MIRGSLVRSNTVNTPVACPLHTPVEGGEWLVQKPSQFQSWSTSWPLFWPICYAQASPEKTKCTNLVASMVEGKRHCFFGYGGHNSLYFFKIRTKHLWGVVVFA